jgi:xylulokinase
MRDLLIGIDIGSTNIRCAVYDTAGRLVSLASCGSERAMSKETWGFGEDELPDTVIGLCNEAIAQIEGTYHIHGMAVACIGCGAMVIGHDGKLIHLKGDYITQARAFFDAISPREVFNITGYPPNHDNLAFRMGAHAGTEVFNMGAHRKTKIAAVLSIADYVAFRLTGEKSREYSTACSMGLWDNHNREWWKDLFNAAGADATKMGEVVNSGTLVGEVLPHISNTSRIPRGTKVYTGGHDYLCSSFAANGYNNQTIVNIVGTYEIMASFHDKPWQREPGNTDPIRPLIDNHVLPGKYSYQIEVYGAGQTEWLRNKIFAADAAQWGDCFAQLEHRDFTAPSTELFIPHLFGQIVPSVNMDAKGAYLFLTDKTDRISLLMATIEGLCYKSREMLDAQRKVAARDFTLKMVGGGSKSRAWVQAKADILGLPVVVPHIQEATALGAAMLAGLAAGVWADRGELRRLKGDNDIFEPRMSRDQAGTLYAGWLKAVGRVVGRGNPDAPGGSV